MSGAEFCLGVEEQTLVVRFGRQLRVQVTTTTTCGFEIYFKLAVVGSTSRIRQLVDVRGD